MSDDQFDQQMRAAARDATAEVHRGVGVDEVEAALEESKAGGKALVRVAPNGADVTEGSRRTWVAFAAAASVAALVVAGAYVLLGGDDQITSDTTSTTQPTVPVVQTAPGSATTTPTTSPTGTTTPVVPATTAPAPTTAATGTTDGAEVSTTTAPPPEVVVIDSLDEVPYERYLPDARCLEDDCAQIKYDATGAAWTFSNGILTEHVQGGAIVPLPEPWASVDIRDIGLLAIGPDEVAYFTVYQAPETSSLVGISIADADAGAEVVMLEGAVDFTGDTYYVPTSLGLAILGCCGADQLRPAPDADLLVAWLERAADHPPLPNITFDAGSLSMTLGDLTWSLGLDTQRLMARGMPRATPTHDGGLIAEFTGLDTANFIVRGWPDGTTSVAELSIDIFVRQLSPEGFVVSVVDGNFVVADVFSERALPERVATTIDFESGTVSLDNAWPELPDTIDARLEWANAIAGHVQLGERRTVEALDVDAMTVAVTTEGYFDDSVFGGRFTIDFESQTIVWSQTCQPDRGQQDYQTEFCV